MPPIRICMYCKSPTKMPGRAPLCGWATAAERSAPRLRWTGRALRRGRRTRSRRTERERESCSKFSKTTNSPPTMRCLTLACTGGCCTLCGLVGGGASVSSGSIGSCSCWLAVGSLVLGRCGVGVCNGREMSAPAAMSCGGCGGRGQMARRSRSSMPPRLPSSSCCAVAARSAIDRLLSALMGGDGGVVQQLSVVRQICN